YTVPFKATFSGDSFAYYNQLKKAQQANYCAYLSMDGFDILSASPELCFKVENNTVTARPMNGTIHRGYTYETDLQHKEWLSASEKNKLENTIIKNLMEKELEKVTIPGTLRTIDPGIVTFSNSFSIKFLITVFSSLFFSEALSHSL